MKPQFPKPTHERQRAPCAVAFAVSAWHLLHILAILLVVASCSRHEVEKPRPSTLEPGTPVLLISIDTLRADRLPAYGYSEGLTPALDALASDSVLFERAYSHTPLTLPSHCTVLTGRLPMGHGVHDNVGYTLDADSGNYLPHALRSVGYRTAAAISALALPASSGLNAGFDFYEDDFQWSPGTGLGEVQRSGQETMARLRPWLEETDSRPPFVLLHLYEPHSPYEAPASPTNQSLSPYDAEVAAADDVVATFLEKLRHLDLYERSLIVLFSDHGEGLGDHGEPEHGLLLYPETLHVPLMMKLPFGQEAGTRRPDTVGLVDIFPTVLGLLGLDPPHPTDGRDLFDPGLHPQPQIAETLYPRLHFGWSELVSVVNEDSFYVHGPDPEFYDLASDPGAHSNQIESKRREAHPLRQVVSNYGLLARTPIATSESADEEARQALGTLGYVTAPAALPSNGQLPDPKARIHTLVSLTEGFQHFREEDFEAAVEAFERAVTDNPALVHAWEYLARSHHNLGHLDDALAAYLQAIEFAGASPSNTAPAAMILMTQGRPEEAIRLLQSQLRLDPAQRRLQDLEVRALLAADRIEEGVDHARTVVNLHPDDANAAYQLSVALLLAGDLEGAAAALQRTLTLDPGHAAATADQHKMAQWLKNSSR